MIIERHVLGMVREAANMLSKSREHKVDSWESIGGDVEALLKKLDRLREVIESFDDNEFDFSPIYVLDELERDVAYFYYKADLFTKREAQEEYGLGDRIGEIRRNPRHRMRRAVKVAERINEMFDNGHPVVKILAEKIDYFKDELDRLKEEQNNACQFCGRPVNYTLVSEKKTLDRVCAHCYAIREEKLNGFSEFEIVTVR